MFVLDQPDLDTEVLSITAGDVVSWDATARQRAAPPP